MTRNDDIERVLDQWFSEGPVQMSDRMFYGTLDRIDRLPRGRLADLQSRLPAMTRNVRLAAAAAVVVLLAGVGAAFIRLPTNVGPGPSPTPTVLPSAIAEALRATWVSVGVRRQPGIVDPIDANFAIGDTSMDIWVWRGAIGNTWSVAGRELVVQFQHDLPDPNSTHPAEHWNCEVGAEGRYAVAFTPDLETLTLDLIADPCAPRTAQLVGGWTRWPCSGPSLPYSGLDVCRTVFTGDLQVAENFHPFGHATTGQLAFRAPGWGKTYSPPQWLTAYDARHLSLVWMSAPEDVWLDVSSNVRPSSMVAVPGAKGPNCKEWAVEVGATPEAIATWLATIPGLVVTKPTTVAVSGFPGVSVDVSLVPGWTVSCPIGGVDGFGNPVYEDVPVSTFAGPEGGPEIDVGDKARYVLLDGGGAQPILIVIQSSAAHWDEAMAAATSLMNSFEFTQ